MRLGRMYQCKECNKKYSKQNRINNPEYFKTAYDNFLKKHPTYRLDKYKEWVSANRDKFLAYQRNYNGKVRGIGDRTTHS